jgi:hypothetical protein
MLRRESLEYPHLVEIPERQDLEHARAAHTANIPAGAPPPFEGIFNVANSRAW